VRILILNLRHRFRCSAAASPFTDIEIRTTKMMDPTVNFYPEPARLAQDAREGSPIIVQSFSPIPAEAEYGVFEVLLWMIWKWMLLSIIGFLQINIPRGDDGFLGIAFQKNAGAANEPYVIVSMLEGVRIKEIIFVHAFISFLSLFTSLSFSLEIGIKARENTAKGWASRRKWCANQGQDSIAGKTEIVATRNTILLLQRLLLSGRRLGQRTAWFFRHTDHLPTTSEYLLEATVRLTA
jgi:hypothetical protein